MTRSTAEVVADIVADVLGIEEIDPADSFYDHDGTSLQALRICARIERATGVALTPVDLLDNDVLGDFVALVSARSAGDGG
ncbi:acyl carrier protein [Micromonospora sp. CPCC 205561]|uniref:acyl carrier protein n=1 Tax=Micromonospora sp. CPCC 205561 TaxID=3122407 RepID=UPI002FF23A86